MDRLQATRIFRAVVEAGSFAGGARKLGLSNAMPSKQVARLQALVELLCEYFRKGDR